MARWRSESSMARWRSARGRSRRGPARGRSRRGLSRRTTLTDCMVMDKKLKTVLSRKENLEIEALVNTKKALQLHDKAARARMLAEDSALEIDKLKKKLFHIQNQFLRGRSFDGPVDRPVEVDNLEAFKYVTDELQLKAVVAQSTSSRARWEIQEFITQEQMEEDEEEDEDEEDD